MASWDQVRELESLLRDLDRARNGGRGRGDSAEPRFLPGVAARLYPLINVGDDSENVYVEALAPGIDPSSLDISVVRNTLSIAGTKEPLDGVTPESVHRSERAAGKFVRSVDLPALVKSEEVAARYEDGVVRITLPKAERARPRQIPVVVN